MFCRDVKSYIYILLDPLGEMVGYVGKSINPEKRFYQHLAERCTNKDKIRWIGKLRELRTKPLLYILEETDTRRERIRESFWIDETRKMGYQLFNIAKVNPKENLVSESEAELAVREAWRIAFRERMQKAKKERALANKIAREQALEARRLEITEHAKNWKEPAPIEPKPNLVLATPQKPASFYLKIVYELLYWGGSAYACYKLFLAFKIIYAFYGK